MISTDERERNAAERETIRRCFRLKIKRMAKFEKPHVIFQLSRAEDGHEILHAACLVHISCAQYHSCLSSVRPSRCAFVARLMTRGLTRHILCRRHTNMCRWLKAYSCMKARTHKYNSQDNGWHLLHASSTSVKIHRSVLGQYVPPTIL
jgi:hypothetical protein